MQQQGGSRAFYDVTLPLRSDMPTYDGEPPPRLTLLKTLAADGVNVSMLSLGVHSGTHVDTPMHFLAAGGDLQAFALDAMLGPCQVVAVPGAGHVRASDLEAAVLPGSERLLLKT